MNAPLSRVYRLARNRCVLRRADGVEQHYYSPLEGGYVCEAFAGRFGTAGEQVCYGLATYTWSSGQACVEPLHRGEDECLATLIRREARSAAGRRLLEERIAVEREAREEESRARTAREEHARANFWSDASYDNGYGRVLVSVDNIVRSTERRVCVRLRVSENFGAQGGYARSWGVRPERRSFIFWCDTDAPPAVRYVKDWLSEHS